MARRYGFKTVTNEEIEMLRGRSTREVIRYLGVSPWKLPLIARAGKKLMAADAHTIPLFPETARMLRALHAAGVKIAVVSSNSEAVIRRVLGEELGDLISLYACGASLFGKARKFKQVTARGVSRDKVICIGDETRDIEAARAVGLDCGRRRLGLRQARDPGPAPAHGVVRHDFRDYFVRRRVQTGGRRRLAFEGACRSSWGFVAPRS